MSSSLMLRAALLTSGLAASVHAYTQVNVASPFMLKNIDPLVFPGSFDKSHLHSFFGSDAVTASTTKSEELRQGCTNAENPNDMSVYWVPTLLYQSGDSWEPVPLSRFSAYYGMGDTPAEIPIPEDLMMLAGDANAQTQADSPEDAHVEWFCEGDESAGLDENGFPSETCSTHLQHLLYFPNCVNHDTLETGYKDGEPGSYHDCPSGMQAMPQLRFSIRFDLRDALPNGWSGTAPLKLASGNAYSAHGDFINGWTEEAGQKLVEATAGKYDYTSVNGELGNDGDLPGCTPQDADPSNGVSDYEESVEVQTTGGSSEVTTEDISSEAADSFSDVTNNSSETTDNSSEETAGEDDYAYNPYMRSYPSFGWTSRSRMARDV